MVKPPLGYKSSLILSPSPQLKMVLCIYGFMGLNWTYLDDPGYSPHLEIGPTWIIQATLPILRCVMLITAAESLLPSMSGYVVTSPRS